MSKLKPDDQYKKYFKQFDQVLKEKCEGMYRTFNTACEKVETKIKSVEKKMVYYVETIFEKTQNEEEFAEKLVNKELRSKIITSQWANYFLADNEEMQLDPITYACARYSLNVAASHADVTPEYFISLNVHKNLIFYVTVASEIIVGPALLALVHISLHPELKSAIVLADVLPIIIRRIVSSNSKPILTQCCKLLASLALEGQNKVGIVTSGCMHGILDLIHQTNKTFFSIDIQIASLWALVNTIHACDANRRCMVELKGIVPLLTAIESPNNAVVLEALKALANTAYKSKYVSGCILSEGGDVSLVEVLQGSDILSHPEICHAALTVLTNLCTYEATQTHVARTPGCMEVALKVLEFALEPYVVQQAANLLLVIMVNNTPNKISAGTKGACDVLMRALVKQSSKLTESSLRCIDRICLALSTFLMFQPNEEFLKHNKGLGDIAKIVKKSTNPTLLASLAYVICTVVPFPDALLRYHNEEFICESERYESGPLLKKIRMQSFSDCPVIPPWLELPVQTLSLSDEGLARAAHYTKSEYVNLLYCYEEFVTPIHPDASIVNAVDIKGLVFSLY